jgi:predicted DNA-binding transcriptional regulator AlpA
MRLLVFRGLKTIKGIPYSRQHIHRLIKDGRFPKPFKPNGGPCGVNAWDESAIDQHQEHCKKRAMPGTPGEDCLAPSATGSANHHPRGRQP